VEDQYQSRGGGCGSGHRDSRRREGRGRKRGKYPKADARERQLIDVQGQKISVKSWYVDGVGIVKQEVEYGDTSFQNGNS